MEIREIYTKILESIKKRGPSLPLQIAKDLNMNSLFVSAFLSELSQDKKIIISDLKVGGSPLYYLTGQESALENFISFLPTKESESVLLLKNKKIIKDTEPEPAIRVALRSIKDFAFPFKFNEELFWRYMLISELEAREIILNSKKIESTKMSEPLINTPKILEKISEKSNEENKLIKSESQEEKIKEPLLKSEPIEIPLKKEIKYEKIESQDFQNPLILEVKSKSKEKSKSEYVLKIIGYLNNHFKIVEEKEFKPKEYTCIIEINSDLGKINFLALAKNKKLVSETDLKEFLSYAQTIPLPALFIHSGKLNKKAQEYEQKYFSVLKTLKLEV